METQVFDISAKTGLSIESVWVSVLWEGGQSWLDRLRPVGEEVCDPGAGGSKGVPVWWWGCLRWWRWTLSRRPQNQTQRPEELQEAPVWLSWSSSLIIVAELLKAFRKPKICLQIKENIFVDSLSTDRVYINVNNSDMIMLEILTGEKAWVCFCGLTLFIREISIALFVSSYFVALLNVVLCNEKN